MKKNGKIEILRFLLCIVVVFYHINKDLWPDGKVFGDFFTLFNHGRTAVEFFFLLTGFLMAKRVHKIHKTRTNSIGEETVSYLYRKIKSVIAPYTVISIVTIVYSSFVVNDIVTFVAERAPSLIFLQRTGIEDEGFITVGWYLGSMFFAIAVIYPFLLKFYDSVSLIAAPVVSSMLIGFFIYRYGYMPQAAFGLFMHHSNLRAVAMILLGVFCYRTCIYMKSRAWAKWKWVLLATVENICWIISLFYLFSNAPMKYEGHITYLMAIAITISFSRDMDYKIYNNKFVGYLGRISLPIYLSQTLPRMIVYFHFPKSPDYIKIIIVVLGSVFIGVVYDLFSNIIIKQRKKKVLA
ncbi:MAG: acyltransferase [Clostridia bacterium]|nr:acyltransferase [Clostridia bacterium]